MECLESPTPDDINIIGTLKGHITGDSSSHKRGAFLALAAAVDCAEDEDYYGASLDKCR